MEADRLTITHGDAGEVLLHGDLDAYSAPLLAAELDTQDRADVPVDMSGVTFMDSTGLRVLVASDNLAKGRGGRVRILCPSVPVRRLFELTALDAHLVVQDGPTQGGPTS